MRRELRWWVWLLSAVAVVALGADQGKEADPTQPQEGQWSPVVDGLRCRLTVPVLRTAQGSQPAFAVQVENASDGPVIWECRSCSLSLQLENALHGYGPGFKVRMGAGCRAATPQELRDILGFGERASRRRNNLEDFTGSSRGSGNFRLAPGGRLTLACKLPQRFTLVTGRHEVLCTVPRYDTLRFISLAGKRTRVMRFPLQVIVAAEGAKQGSQPQP